MNPSSSSIGVFGWLAQMLISIFKMITKTAKVVESAVDMAHAAVEVSGEEQTIELTVRRIDMRKRIVDQATLRAAKQEEQMQDYGRKSEEHKKMLDQIRANLNTHVDAALAYRKTE